METNYSIQMNEELLNKAIDITEFKPFEIGGFTLSGWKDGERKIKLKDRTIDFPNSLTCNSVVYTLEEIAEFPHADGRIFLNLEYC